MRLWHCINICHSGQFFSLPRQIKPVEDVYFTNLWEQENQAIKKFKDIPFMHWVITKKSCYNNSQDYNNEARPYPALPLG